MQVSWFNEDGEPIDIGNVKQGQTIYGNYKIRNSSVIPVIDEVALGSVAALRLGNRKHAPFQ
jgi:hypothetical protein